MLGSHDTIVYKALEGLSIFTLKHEFELFPALVGLISSIKLYVKGVQVI